MKKNREDWLRRGESDFHGVLIALIAQNADDRKTVLCWCARAGPFRHGKHWNVLEEALISHSRRDIKQTWFCPLVVHNGKTIIAWFTIVALATIPGMSFAQTAKSSSVVGDTKRDMSKRISVAPLVSTISAFRVANNAGTLGSLSEAHPGNSRQRHYCKPRDYRLFHYGPQAGKTMSALYRASNAR